MKKQDYEPSRDIWYAWRKIIRKETGSDPIQGFCNWEHEFDNFKLECWNTEDGSTIFQFWPDGNGFHIYVGYNSPIMVALKDCAEAYHDRMSDGSIGKLQAQDSLKLYNKLGG